MNRYDLYFSYHSELRFQINQLYERLTDEHNIKIFQKSEDRDFEYVAFLKGIKHSEVFVSCVSKQYLESRNCIKEIRFAYELDKPIIILLINDYEIEDLDLPVEPVSYVKCYSKEIYHGKAYEDILKSIKKVIPGLNQGASYSDEHIQEFGRKFWNQFKLAINENEREINKNQFENNNNQILSKNIKDKNSDLKISKSKMNIGIKKWWDSVDFGNSTKSYSSNYKNLYFDIDNSISDIDYFNNSNINNHKEIVIEDEISEIDRLIEFNKQRKLEKKNKNQEKKSLEKIFYDNGDIYEGEVFDDEFHGHGTYIWKDKSKYIGQWFKNLRHGKGNLYLANGERYEGEFQNSAFNGTGTYYLKNGDRYSGGFINGLRDGIGVYYYADGSKIDTYYINGQLIQNNGFTINVNSKIEDIYIDLPITSNYVNYSILDTKIDTN